MTRRIVSALALALLLAVVLAVILAPVVAPDHVRAFLLPILES